MVLLGGADDQGFLHFLETRSYHRNGMTEQIKGFETVVGSAYKFWRCVSFCGILFSLAQQVFLRHVCSTERDLSLK